MIPLHKLLEESIDEDLIKYIHERTNFKLSDRTPSEQTLLHYAALNRYGNVALRYLLNLGIDINIKGLYLETPLHGALRYGDYENTDIFLRSILLMLLECGADVNLQTEYGETALHYALRYKAYSAELLVMLFSFGADVNVINCQGKSVMKLALDDDCWILDTVKLIAMHEVMGKPVSSENMEILHSCEKLKKHYDTCRTELQMMKETIFVKELTFFDLLTQPISRLVSFYKDQQVARRFNAWGRFNHHQDLLKFRHRMIIHKILSELVDVKRSKLSKHPRCLKVLKFLIWQNMEN